MAEKTDQEISSEQYVDQMNLIIEYLENNIKYMEREIEIKQRMLQTDKGSLVHEKQALEKYLSKQN